MPEFNKTLSMTQLFNFKKDQQTPVGVIQSFKIGTTMFDADLMITDPSNVKMDANSQNLDQTAGALPIVAGLSQISWDLGDTNPIKIEGFVGARNKQRLNALLYSSMIDISVSISWTIFDYDLIAKTYFVCFATNGFDSAGSKTPVFALVAREGSDLKLTVTDEICEDVNSPKMFKFTLDVVPQPKAQKLALAASTTDKVLKSWGRQGPGGTA